MQPIQYVVRGHAGYARTDWIELVPIEPFQTEDSILSAWRDTGWDWFWNFNDEEDFEDIEPELDMWVEEYDPEEHDGLLS